MRAPASRTRATAGGGEPALQAVQQDLQPDLEAAIRVGIRQLAGLKPLHEQVVALSGPSCEKRYKVDG